MNEERPEANDAPRDSTASRAEKQSDQNGAHLSIAEQLAVMARERDEYLDQLQRSRAEFANYQKRIRTQSESDRLYAAGNLVSDLLGVLDNMERAIDVARAAGSASIVDGLTLVHKQLLDTLAKHGVEAIQALGQAFDPNQHEAIAQKADSRLPEGTIVAELARGYKLHDRVLRPSRVTVAVRPEME